MIAAEEDGKDKPLPLEMDEYYSAEMDQVDDEQFRRLSFVLLFEVWDLMLMSFSSKYQSYLIDFSNVLILV